MEVIIPKGEAREWDMKRAHGINKHNISVMFQFMSYDKNLQFFSLHYSYNIMYMTYICVSYDFAYI